MDQALCPGGQVSGIGCQKPNCDFGSFSECECEGQFWINDDCNQGFYCTGKTPDNYIYNGCVQTCLNGQVLLPDFENKNWACVDKSEFFDFKCPGQFNFECPENDVGSDFTGEECDCDHQIIISADCSEGFYCFESEAGKGLDLKCPEGKILDVNPGLQTWKCIEDNGSCPGLGGFKVGCSDGNEIPPPEIGCDRIVKNPLGECTCPGQFFFGDDCTELFYCFQGVTTDGADGCHLKCENGQVAALDLANQRWECIDQPDEYVCPGAYNTNCPETPYQPECGCAGEVWVNEDCSEGFVCDAEKKGEANTGDFVTCNEGEIVAMNLQSPLDSRCIPDEGQCPGSFNAGCKGENGNGGEGGNSAASASLSLILVVLGAFAHVRFF